MIKCELAVIEKLERLYDNEINWELSCFWDGGYEMKLGDPINGFVASSGGFDTIKGAVDWVWARACVVYPLLEES